MPVDTERTHFLALWGILLGSGFALAVAITAVAFATVPRCAG
jgi:heme/copper-type cytochrome/quinol oxidase subunit 4